jgi:hypothetical protein
MRLSATSSAFFAISTAVAKAASSDFDTSKFKPEDIIERDVAVIGGGSSGTYAAIALKDSGKSVIVVEKKGRMGGHASTYTDEATGEAVDMGIIIFHNITEVKDFYARFDLPLSPSDSFYTTQLHFDFCTGEPVASPPSSTFEETLAAFDKYLAVYNKYPGLTNGTILPDPVPKELYSPFGEFVEKYGIQAAVPPMYFYNPGVGDIMSNPLIEQFRYWSSHMVGGVANGFLSPVSRNVSEIFGKAEAELLSESSVLSSEVVRAHRPEDDEEDVKLVVRTPTGSKLIIAKKLVIAIPPKVNYMAPFDLNGKEKSLFCKYINSGYYVGVLKNSGLFDNASITNAAEGNTEFKFPHLPAAYSFAPSPIPGLQLVTYATEQTKQSEPMTDEEVQTEVINTVKRLQKENPEIFAELTEPEFVDFHSHAPYSLQVRAKAIKNGFYEKLYKLQGQRNTHWNGAAWKGEDSSLLWKYTKEHVVPQVLEGL